MEFLLIILGVLLLSASFILVLPMGESPASRSSTSVGSGMMNKEEVFGVGGTSEASPILVGCKTFLSSSLLMCWVSLDWSPLLDSSLGG